MGRAEWVILSELGMIVQWVILSELGMIVQWVILRELGMIVQSLGHRVFLSSLSCELCSAGE